MSFVFGKKSKAHLANVHPDMAKVMYRVLELSPVDFGITCSERTVEEQVACVVQKKSKTLESKHLPSLVRPGLEKEMCSGAVDIVCYNHLGKIQYEGAEHLYHSVAAVVKAVSEELNIPIRWGGDWDRDGDTTDQTFNDLPHFELWSGHYCYDFACLKNAV